MTDEENGSEWTLNDEGQAQKKEQSGRKLKIEVSRDAEVDSLHEELAKVKNQLNEGDQERIEAEKDIMALELFDTTKNYEAQLRPSLRSQILEAKTPSELERIIGSFKPSGKAQMEKSESPTASMGLDELYTILKFPQNYDKEIVKDAQIKRTTLIENLLKSPSLETMRREGRTVYADNSFMLCPKCERNAILSTIDIKKNPRCKNCGYLATEDERRR